MPCGRCPEWEEQDREFTPVKNGYKKLQIFPKETEKGWGKCQGRFTWNCPKRWRHRDEIVGQCPHEHINNRKS